MKLKNKRTKFKKAKNQRKKKPNQPKQNINTDEKKTPKKPKYKGWERKAEGSPPPPVGMAATYNDLRWELRGERKKRNETSFKSIPGCRQVLRDQYLAPLQKQTGGKKSPSARGGGGAYYSADSAAGPSGLLSAGGSCRAGSSAGAASCSPLPASFVAAPAPAASSAFPSAAC